MATPTIRNLAPEAMRALKARAARNGRSMEQEVRELIDSPVADRSSAVEQISRAWATQKRVPSAKEIGAWIHG
ncbi:MAG TPA: hypothetical protein VHO06_09905 [Polyangia bacterium]|nr:hypothetical protein [Polyangia bacterium]